MNTRLLGVFFVVGSAVGALDGVRTIALGGSLTDPYDTLSLIAGIVLAVGVIAGLLGMIHLNAIGSNALVRALGFIPIIGFGLQILANILQVVGVLTTANNPLAGFASILQIVGMLIVGILTIAAKTWRGWRRFLPLLTVVIIPIYFGLSGAIGNLTLAGLLGLSIYVVYGLLGYVIATTEPVAVQQKLATSP